MNKFELMNKVTISRLAPGDKVLLIELILRWNTETGQLNPSVERLCKARGIKHEKNFKGVETYLEGLVTKEKRGRKNYYQLNIEAIGCLEPLEVTIKHTPALEGVSSKEVPANTDTPADEGVYYPAAEGVNTPAGADNTPAVEGANSSIYNSVDSSSNTSMTAVADAPSLTSREYKEQGEDVEVTKNVVVSSVESPLVVDSNLPGSSLESDSVPSFADFLDSLETEKKSSAPANTPAHADGPAQEDISFEEFLEWAETASEPEQEIAAYGLEYKKYDALAKVILVAKESTKAEYDEWTSFSHKYTYAEQNVNYDGPGRKTSASVASNNDILGEW